MIRLQMLSGIVPDNALSFRYLACKKPRAWLRAALSLSIRRVREAARRVAESIEGEQGGRGGGSQVEHLAKQPHLGGNRAGQVVAFEDPMRVTHRKAVMEAIGNSASPLQHCVWWERRSQPGHMF